MGAKINSTGKYMSEIKKRARFEREKYVNSVKGLFEEEGSSMSWSLQQLPKDGVYVGTTTESDGVTQETRLTFEFTSDGRILGRGNDSIDGKYKIVDGTWKKKNGIYVVYWKEIYEYSRFRY